MSLLLLPCEILARIAQALRGLSQRGLGALFLTCKAATAKLSRESEFWSLLGIRSDQERKRWIGRRIGLPVPLRELCQFSYRDERRALAVTVSGVILKYCYKTQVWLDRGQTDPRRLVKRLFLAPRGVHYVLYSDGSLEFSSPGKTVSLMGGVVDAVSPSGPLLALTKSSLVLFRYSPDQAVLSSSTEIEPDSLRMLATYSRYLFAVSAGGDIVALLGSDGQFERVPIAGWDGWPEKRGKILRARYYSASWKELFLEVVTTRGVYRVSFLRETAAFVSLSRVSGAPEDELL